MAEIKGEVAENIAKDSVDGKQNSNFEEVKSDGGVNVSLNRLSFRHEESMADKEHQFQKELLNKKLGYLGKLFGQKEIIPLNVSGLLLLILVLFLAIVSICLIRCENNSTNTIKMLWDIVSPIITLTLGYLFGIRSSASDDK